jgi:CheY-like chemotaxis protein
MFSASHLDSAFGTSADWWPAKPPAAAPDASAGGFGKDKTRQPGNILVVEDHEDLRDALCLMLQLAGYQVTGVSNGREAMDYLGRGGPACLILLDLMMPVMDGWCFRREQLASADLASIPVVVITAAGRQQRLDSLAATDYFSKPVDFDRLLRVVKSHCG